MMMKFWSKGALAAIASSVLLAGLPATAAFEPTAPLVQEKPKKKKKERKVPALREPIYKKIEKANEAVDLEAYDDALTILTDLRGSRRSKLNEYELAVTYTIEAQIAFARDDQMGAIKAFETILQYRESIPEAQEVNIVYNLSQLWASQDDFKKAVEYFRNWEKITTLVTAKNNEYAATLFYRMEDYQEALRYIDLTIKEAEESETLELKENWYSLRFTCQYSLEQREAALATTEFLVITWPKPSYWLQMAQINQELDRQETFYSLVEAAYEQGYLDDKPAQIINVANILGARDVPIKGAWLVEDSIRKGLVEDNAKNQLLLGRLLMRAKEDEKAITPLSRGAQGDDSLDPSGDTWMQVAFTLKQLDRNTDAVISFKRAIALFEKDLKNEKRKSTAKKRLFELELTLGMTYVDLKQWDSSEKALNNAKKYATSRRQKKDVARRLEYMKGERQRENILAGVN